MSERRFNANPPEGQQRCSANITLRDGSQAQCMRRAKVDGMCKQHSDIQERDNRLLRRSVPSY